MRIGPAPRRRTGDPMLTHLPWIREGTPMEPTAAFGAWLRQRRKALDLTQETLARRVGCAEVTIQKIEADERRPSREVAVRLAHALEVPATEQELFIRCARGERAADRLPVPTMQAGVPTVIQTPRHATLPAPLTPLIGRAHEVAAVCLLVQRPDVRLVTLTGVGGTGKTRLAFQV